MSNRETNTRRYPSHLCLLCGARVSEGAFSAKLSNFRRHVAACQQRVAIAKSIERMVRSNKEEA